jgi:LmbE family N-acetylglucosaminyl deacetylase
MSCKRLRIAVVSPHCDDAALSIAAALHALARGGAELAILSVFTESAWAPYLPGPAEVEPITRLRAAEDAAYARSLGARVIPLGLRDGPLRCPGRHLFGADEEGDGEDARRLAAALRPHFASADALLAPIGILHIDHRIAREAALAAWRRRDVAFYEDLPYAKWIRPTAVRRAVAELGEAVRRRLEPVTIAPLDWLEVRGAAAGWYPSQLGVAELTELTAFIEAQGGERVWASRGLRRTIERLVTRPSGDPGA